MQAKGLKAEEQASFFLKKLGYVLIARNFRCCFGEIDIIARDRDVLCFIEVKSRNRDDFGSPAQAVTNAKQRKIIRSAAYYLERNHAGQEPACRFDVVSILPGQEPEVIQDAFQMRQSWL